MCSQFQCYSTHNDCARHFIPSFPSSIPFNSFTTLLSYYILLPQIWNHFIFPFKNHDEIALKRASLCTHSPPYSAAAIPIIENTWSGNAMRTGGSQFIYFLWHASISEQMLHLIHNHPFPHSPRLLIEPTQNSSVSKHPSSSIFTVWKNTHWRRAWTGTYYSSTRPTGNSVKRSARQFCHTSRIDRFLESVVFHPKPGLT